MKESRAGNLRRANSVEELRTALRGIDHTAESTECRKFLLDHRTQER